MFGYIILFALWITVHSSNKNVVKVSPALLAEANITVSSELEYHGQRHNKEYIFLPGNTSLRACDCCYSSVSEPFPWLEIELPYQTHIAYIHIKGRTDFQSFWFDRFKETRNIQFLQIEFDSEESPYNMSDYNISKNTLTVYPLSTTTKGVRITRPKYNRTTDWYLQICEIEFYEKADVASGCPAGKDFMDLHWDRGAKGLFTRGSCPYGYNGYCTNCECGNDVT